MNALKKVLGGGVKSKLGAICFLGTSRLIDEGLMVINQKLSVSNYGFNCGKSKRQIEITKILDKLVTQYIGYAKRNTAYLLCFSTTTAILFTRNHKA